MDWHPAVGQVAELLRARTYDAEAGLVNTFNEKTRPTGDEVMKIIASSAGIVGTVIGTKAPPDELVASVQLVIALHVAQVIELSYFPEAVASGKSAYDNYVEMYERDLKNLKIAIQQAADKEVIGAEGGANTPVASFPSSKSGIRLDTKW